jgi:hypothetical protein
MRSNILAFAAPSTERQQAFADLYRAQDLLLRAGFQLDARYGTTDEGDPWVAFCDPQSGEAIIDVALIDGEIVANSKAFVSPAKTSEIAATVRGMLRNLRLDRDALGSGTHLLVALAVVLATFQVADADPSSWTAADIQTLVLAPALTGLGAIGAVEKVVQVAEVMSTEMQAATVAVIASLTDQGASDQHPHDVAHVSGPIVEESVIDSVTAQANYISIEIPPITAPEVQSLAMALVASLDLPGTDETVALSAPPGETTSVVHIGQDFELAVDILTAFTSQFPYTQLHAEEGAVFLYGEGTADFHELIFEDGSRAFLIGSEANTPYNDLF